MANSEMASAAAVPLPLPGLSPAEPWRTSAGPRIAFSLAALVVYRPGKATADYIDHVLTRMTLLGGIYLASVSELPELLISNILLSKMDLPIYFDGASLLIVVVVMLHVISAVRTELPSERSNPA